MQVSAGEGDSQGIAAGPVAGWFLLLEPEGKEAAEEDHQMESEGKLQRFKGATGDRLGEKKKRNIKNILELENLLNLSHASEPLTSLICGKKHLLQVNPVFGSAWRGLLQPCTPQRAAAPLQGSQKERLGRLRHSQTSLNSSSLSEQKPQKFSQGGHGRYHGGNKRKCLLTPDQTLEASSLCIIPLLCYWNASLPQEDKTSSYANMSTPKFAFKEESG